jgi:hypothetical protein
MTDLDRGIRETAHRYEPPKDWLERVRARALRRHRNRRIAATALGVGVSVVVIVALALTLSGPDPVRPADPQPVIPRVPCESGATTPPTGWWRAEGSGADATGGQEATLRGDTTFAAGIVGGAFTFDGDGDFAEVPDDPAINVGADDFTLSFWVRFESAEGQQVLLEDWVETFDPATSQGWLLTKMRGPGIAWASGAGLVTAKIDAVGDWNHIAVRRRGGRVSIFVNGVFRRSQPLSDPQRSLDSPASLKFGHRGTREDTPGSLDERGFFLHGALDEIELFVGRGLANQEIRRIFETQSACAG